jgi:hypothetical protein
METVMNMKIEWVKPQRGRTGRVAGGGLRITRNDYLEKGSGNVRESTVLRISSDVMKKARFVIGDRVLVGAASFGEKKFVAIKRVPDDGYTISSSDKDKKGAIHTGHVKISNTGIPLGEWCADDVKVTDDGVLLAEVIENDKT